MEQHSRRRSRRWEDEEDFRFAILDFRLRAICDLRFTIGGLMRVGFVMGEVHEAFSVYPKTS